MASTIQRDYLTKSLQVMLLTALLLALLHVGRPFLIPLAFGAILATVLTPVCDRLDRIGLPHVLASIAGVLLFIVIVGGVVALIVWQISGFDMNLFVIQDRVNEMVDEVRLFISNKLGLDRQEQQDIIESNESLKSAMSTVASIPQGVVNGVLALVYMFLFIYFRRHIHKSIVMFVPSENRPNAEKIIHDASRVAQKHLFGLSIMILFLWIMYGIGFTIIGVKNALLLAVICGTLEVIPFVGNLTGTTLTALLVLSQGGSNAMVIGVLITYFTIQATQSYMIAPIVIGRQVNINPVFVVIGVVLGALIWGIAGMILAMPLLGMVKIVCDHIESLKPIGHLIGRQRQQKREGVLARWFANAQPK